MGHTLEAFDDDKLIPTLGFGDTRTSCVSFFNLGVNSAPCRGLAEVLDRYKQVTPFVQLSGPTNFAPVIHETIRIVQQSRQYHILVIIADGQVSNATETRNAIVAASNYPISIIMVGVGDGPWDMMKAFDNELPARRFDNFQFVEYTKVLLRNPTAPEVGFATAALMEIPAELQQALRRAGLESSNLVVAIDYTKSNEWSGEKSFQGKSLHYIDPTGANVNPYQVLLHGLEPLYGRRISSSCAQSVIHIMGRTLEVFDDDKLIPVLGFGDVQTGSTGFFSLGVNNRPCHGFDEVLARYKELTPTIHLSGPTNFAPVIHETIRIVQETRQYHILVIVADGQVTSEKETQDAIVAASNYPICELLGHATSP
ncbi:hypothetical protein DYB32_010328 [Aphanomyces invadans]|uniref:Copine C-terminal domain-containing protein n=1 Tax=Aphanomyces invadans TaxID=157072 RepID=A0A418APN7_9STRA|nr:hypothetical protein DYB32_010328 [Aphanomyces invadans]